MSSSEILEPVRRKHKLNSKSSRNIDREMELIGDHQNSASNLPPFVMHVHDWVHTCINVVREPIAEIQEKRGISRHQRFTFVDLMTALFNHSYNSCMCIFTMIVGLLPLLEGLLNLVRFVLDKMLEIDECKSITEKVIKLGIFVAELFVIFVIVSLIVTIILLPVAHLVEYSLYKIWRLAN